MRDSGADLHVLRDPTCGGLATPLNEIAQQSGGGIMLQEKALPANSYHVFVEADSVTQRNDQATYLAQFGENQRPGIGHVIGVDDAKNIAATINIADCRSEFRSHQSNGRALRLCSFALDLHDSDTPSYFFLKIIVAISRQLKNTQKAIDRCQMEKLLPPRLAPRAVRFLA